MLVWTRVGYRQWFEIDGLRAEVTSPYLEGFQHRQRVRPPGYPPISFNEWSFDAIFRVFGVIGPQLKDGMCGVTIVQVEPFE